MNETSLTKYIMLALGKLPFLRIFRNNTGQAWQGETGRQWQEGGHRYMIIKDPRPLHAGLCVGSSDLIGWSIVKVTPEMVGQNIAVFTAIEIKAEKGRASKEQLNFLQVVQQSGGVAGIAKTEQDALNIVKGGLL
jgi:hypothetical protein